MQINIATRGRKYAANRLDVGVNRLKFGLSDPIRLAKNKKKHTHTQVCAAIIAGSSQIRFFLLILVHPPLSDMCPTNLQLIFQPQYSFFSKVWV